MSPLFIVLVCLSPASPPLGELPNSPSIAQDVPNATRPGDGQLKTQAACPGSMLQPFLRLPSVRPVGPCESGSGAGQFDVNGLWVKEFHHAANFRIPRFARDGNAAPTDDGLLIYEGMRLTVYPATGLYDVEFTATVPSTPVTVHLQLVFTPNNQFGMPSDPSSVAYHITLPPIRLDPNLNAIKDGDPSGNTFNISHRGYSSLIRNGIITAQVYNLSRVGTARFGTPIAVDELGR